jgi:hypothetical protein
MTLSDAVNLQTLPIVPAIRELGVYEPDGLCRINASGNVLPSWRGSMQTDILSLCLRRLRPEALSGVLVLGSSVPNLRELFFPEGMKVLPSQLCGYFSAIEKSRFSGTNRSEGGGIWCIFWMLLSAIGFASYDGRGNPPGI